ncbi:citrate synthase [Iamia sp.]|uniref:citrate synthase n=1 Tax=Iamia sp. TaxID=2722710 RepID=UPI002CDC41CE|nr:citrate synthase [Iamia sp.]HXH58703.1 citrate synthase [Iamia sp.]
MATMTAPEVASRLGVKLETVYAYVSRGALGRVRSPGSRASLFDADEVEALARRGRPRRTTRSAALDFVIETRLTSIDAHGLRYRGHDVAGLAQTASFEQVAELLWTGTLPDRWRPWDPVEPAVSDVGGIRDRLRLAVALAAAGDPLRADLRRAAVARTGEELIGAMVGALAIRGDGRTPRLTVPDGAEPRRGTIAGRLWTRLAPARPRPGMLGALNAALVLLADHELAVSTLAARVAASARADPYAVVLAGLGPLSGPLHGGAGRMARDVLDAAAVEGPGPALAHALEIYGAYPGFGQPLYPDGDPRARVLLDLVRGAAGGSRALAVAESVLSTAQRRVHVEPNIDFALAVLGSVASMPPDTSEAIFTIARSAGWLAHAIEEYHEAPLRFRPRAVYIG